MAKRTNLGAPKQSAEVKPTEATPTKKSRLEKVSGFWKRIPKVYDGKSEAYKLSYGWMLIFLLIGLVLGSHWWKIVFSIPGLICIIALILFGTMLPAQKISFSTKLAQYGIGLAAFVLVWSIVGSDLVSSAEKGKDISPTQIKTGILDRITNAAIWVVSSVKESGYRLSTASGPSVITASNTDTSNMSEVQVAYQNAFFKSYRPTLAQLMMKVVEKESGFNMSAENGTAICASQIKTDVWGDIAQKEGYNLKTLDGCLSMTLWILNHQETGDSRGVFDWEPSLVRLAQESKMVKIFDAPVGAPGDEIITQSGCDWEVDRQMVVLDDKNVGHDFFPGKPLELVTTKFRLMTYQGKPPAKMVYWCSPG